MSAENPIFSPSDEFPIDPSDTVVDMPSLKSFSEYFKSQEHEPFIDPNPTQIDIPVDRTSYPKDITKDVSRKIGSAYSTTKDFVPALTDLRRDSAPPTPELQKPPKALHFLMAIALTSGALYAYLDGKSNSVVEVADTYQTNQPVVANSYETNESIAQHTNDAVLGTLEPQVDIQEPTTPIDLVPQTFQDHQLEPEDTSVELAERFAKDFAALKVIISNLNIRQRVAYENFNHEVFTNKLIHIALNYNREQKMQVYDYLEGLSIIPSSAREIMQRNTSALFKIYDYLRDFNGESKVERRERVKQRAYSLLLRAVVERAPIEELTFIINSFNSSAGLSNNSSYIDVVEAIGNDSQYNLDADRIMSIEPFESNGLYADVEFFYNNYKQIIPHADILTPRTVVAIGIHETAPRFTQVEDENQELANMIAWKLGLGANSHSVVNPSNGILTLGPTQLQDWDIQFDRFPQVIQDKVIALGAHIGLEITDIVSAVRAAVLSPEIQYLLSTSLISVNYETLYNNIPEFRTASIATQRRALVLSNYIGAGSKGIQVIRRMIRNNNWDSHGYVKSVYKYISFLQTIFR